MSADEHRHCGIVLRAYNRGISFVLCAGLFLLFLGVPVIVGGYGLDPAQAAEECNGTWADGFGWPYPGIEGTVRCAVEYEGALYVGGDFKWAGGLRTGGIARWDQSGWSAVGPGLDGEVRALAVYGGKLVAGGFFQDPDHTSAYQLAQWDGSEWQALAAARDGLFINALAVYDGKLIAGGDFGYINEIWANRVAQWDGTQWQGLGDGISLNIVRVSALASYNGKLIAEVEPFCPTEGCGGDRFQWDGATWQPMGTGLWGAATAFAVYDGNLIAGGFFSFEGDSVSTNFARWDGTEWQPFGTWNDEEVHALISYNGKLVAGGAGAGSTGFITEWNGTTWQTMDSAPDGPVYSLAVYDGLVVGGDFNAAGDIDASGIARWTGQAWASMDLRAERPRWGLSGPVKVLTTYNGKLIAAGWFTSAGGVPAKHIAQWDGVRWEPMGAGLDGDVYALAAYEGKLVAGGSFQLEDVSGVPVVQWDGTAWHPMDALSDGDVLEGRASAFTIHDGKLIAGGDFRDNYLSPGYGLAEWDGAAWHPLDEGSNQRIAALTVYDGKLVAEVGFASGISEWDGATWRPLGSQQPKWPYVEYSNALAVYNGKLIVGLRSVIRGPYLLMYGGIAQWDGAEWQVWSAPPVINEVTALTIYGGKLIVGSRGPATSSITTLSTWDGNTWQSCSGTDGDVLAMAAYDGSLFVGGDFTTAGGFQSDRISRWTSAQAPIGFSDLQAIRVAEGVRIQWSIAGEVRDYSGFRVYRESPSGEPIRLTPELPGDRIDYDYIDEDAPGGSVNYWLEEVSRSGSMTWHGPLRVGPDPGTISVTLLPGRPNPFTTRTEILFRTHQEEPVRVTVFDLSGRRVIELVSEVMPAGRNAVAWDGRNEANRLVPSGLYLYRVETPRGTVSGKVVKVH